MNVKTCFSERLKALREAKGMSQSELAEAIGISRGSVSFYENADRTADIETLYSVAKFFDVSTEYLLGISPVEGTFTPVTAGDGTKTEALSSFSKMRISEVYYSLSECVLAFEDYFSSRNSDGKRGPWACEHLFTSVRSLVASYAAVVQYLEKGLSLSSAISKYREVYSGSDQSLAFIEELARWMEG